MKGAVHVCSFEAVDLPKRGLTYELFRERVLQAGRFSIFEATETQRLARWYTRLCAEPDIVTENTGRFAFPWTGIRLRTPEEIAERERLVAERRAQVAGDGLKARTKPWDQVDAPLAADDVPVHAAAAINRAGGVMPVCAKTPRAISLHRGTWTLLWDNVTCKKCLRIGQERERAKGSVS